MLLALGLPRVCVCVGEGGEGGVLWRARLSLCFGVFLQVLKFVCAWIFDCVFRCIFVWMYARGCCTFLFCFVCVLRSFGPGVSVCACYIFYVCALMCMHMLVFLCFCFVVFVCACVSQWVYANCVWSTNTSKNVCM